MSNILFKKLCRELNEFADSNDYKKPACIRVEFTSFQPIHKAIRGRNSVGELVELQTQVIEADAVHVEQWERSSSLAVYVQARTRSSHGFGSESGIYLRVRDPKGKYHTLEAYPKWERDEVEVNRFQSVFGYVEAADFQPNEFKEFREENGMKILRLASPGGAIEESEIMDDSNREAMARTFTQEFYKYLINYQLKDGDTEDFEKFLEFRGFKLVKCFVFTDRFWGISPKYFDHGARGFEIGWRTNSTYNSLPQTLKVFKSKGIKAVKLADLGVEGAGYYSHHDNMRVRTEQVKAAKQFGSRFETKARQITERIVTGALRKAS